MSQRRPRIFERGTKFISATTYVRDAITDSMNMGPRVSECSWFFVDCLFADCLFHTLQVTPQTHLP